MHTLLKEYDLGYIFYPPVDPHDPGHPRLDINMRAEPTYRHFDPEHVLINVITTTEGLQSLKLQHPWTGTENYHVFPGRVTMQDRLNETATAFTFGGELTIETQEEKTTCILTSSAPILGLIFDHAISVLLSEQAEIYLAELRASWAHDPEELERKLAASDPMELYATFLQDLREKFKSYPKLEDPISRAFLHYLYVTSHQIHDSQSGWQSSQVSSGLAVR